jgi:hypothetical protein
MKRKPLSMKKLCQYMVEYLADEIKKETGGKTRNLGVSQVELSDKIDKKNHNILDFIDYIWKNPR